MGIPQFSVVIPTHNRAHLVGRALRSVEAQTLPVAEVIVVDDGSSDTTQHVLGSSTCRSLRILRNDFPQGVSASRNRGVAAVSSEFVVFLDDDDEFRPHAIEALSQKLATNPQLDFAWGTRLIHEKNAAGFEIGKRKDDWNSLSCEMSGSIFLPMVLEIATNAAFTIRRSVFDKLGGFDEQLKVSEDRDLFLSLAENGHAGAAVSSTIIDVDEHFKSSLSRTVGHKVGPEIDLRVIEKHRSYLSRPEHQGFLNAYLLTIFAGFLQAGRRGAAMRIAGQLARRGALDAQLVRKYLRHAPEFRALKALVRYDDIRRMRNAVG